MSLRDVLVIAIKLLVASLIVGLIFRALDIHPRALLRDIPDVIRDVFRLIVQIADWGIPYVLLGAVIVVPVWLLFTLFRLIRRR